MGAEELLNSVKINVEKYGFFFWLIIFGFIEVIFSIIHAKEYVLLGLYFWAFGALGYSISEIMDRISYGTFKKESQDQAGKNVWVVKVPTWFHLLNAVLKLFVFCFLFFAINRSYHYI